LEQARKRLLDWDYVLDEDSVAAGIYVMWQERLQANVRELFLGGESLEHLRWSMSMKRIVDHLLAPRGEFGDDPIAGRDALLERSLEEAVAELTRRFGGDMNAWRYG